jgi:Trk K+ transport system NAD-binding subunit
MKYAKYILFVVAIILASCTIDEDVTNGKKIGELNLPRLSRVVVIRRGEENICPDPTITLLSGDTILLYVDSQVIRQTENIFA